MNVYYSTAKHLGDCWGTANLLLHIAEESNEKIIFQPCKGQFARYENILRLLDGPTNCIELIEYDYANRVLIGAPQRPNTPFVALDCHYFPTKIRWKPGVYKQICYQFDGNSHAGAKNPPTQDITALTSFIRGVQFVRLGGHLSLDECVKIASQSDAFIGVCSGMSHVCHSVGVPTFLIQYRFPISEYHKNKNYTLCKGTLEGIHAVQEFLHKKYICNMEYTIMPRQVDRFKDRLSTFRKER